MSNTGAGASVGGINTHKINGISTSPVPIANPSLSGSKTKSMYGTIKDSVSGVYNGYVSTPYGQIKGQVKSLAKNTYQDGPIVVKTVYDFATSNYGRNILSIAALLLLGKILAGTIDGLNTNDDTNLTFLQQCVWAWTCIFCIIIAMNMIFSFT